LLHRWKSSGLPHSLFTEDETQKPHGVFGHPSVRRLSNLPKRARFEEMNAAVRDYIQKITDRFKTCSKTAQRPRYFRLQNGEEDRRFNHIVACYVMYLNGRAVLHVVDEATHFQAARFLQKVRAEETSRSLVKCWIRTYLGPPSFLRVDQGTNFITKKFKARAEIADIEVLEAPVECPTTMKHVERYHGPLRVAYNRLNLDDPTLSVEDILALAVKCVDDTCNLEVLTPTFLGFGSIPRPRTTPAETQICRARAIEAARNEILSEYARQRVWG
jgi:hypothetical protein